MLRTKLLRSALPTASSISSPTHTAPWLSQDAIPTVKNYINGQFVTSVASSDMIHLYDPSTNNHLANIPNDKSSATAAIQAASCSYPKWRGTPVQVRQRYMMEYTHALHKKEVREEIAHWITLEMGKTEGDAMGDVWRGLEVVEAAGRVGSEMMVSYLIVLCRY